jgi:hypothetical protein
MAVDTGGSAAWGASVVDFRDLAFARYGAPPAEPVAAGDRPGGRWVIGLEVDIARVRAEVQALFGGSSS